MKKEIHLPIVALAIGLCLGLFFGSIIRRQCAERDAKIPHLTPQQEKELYDILDAHAEPLPHYSNGETQDLALIMNARQFQFRMQVAFLYALPFTNNDPRFEDGLLRAAGREVRRAALCQDAPQWVKDLLPGTIWWATNLPADRWPKYKDMPPAGVNDNLVDRNDQP